MTNGIIAILSICIWIAFSNELAKPSNNRNKQKFYVLLYAGLLSTCIVTFTMFQSL